MCHFLYLCHACRQEKKARPPQKFQITAGFPSRLTDIHQQDSHQHKQSSTHDNHQQRTTIRSHLTTTSIHHQQVHFSPDNHQHRTTINNHHWGSYRTGPLSLGPTGRPLRVPEGTRYSVFKITTRTLLEKFYYSAE